MDGVGAAKSFFFTTVTVRNQLDRTERRLLSKVGAYTRKRAKSSLRYKDGPAPPGKPPHVHRSSGFTKPGSKKKGKPQPASPLRELTYFAYDPADKSVVIGPAIGGPRSGAPETIEEGGTARIDGRTVTIRPRPWVLPAFQVALKEVRPDLRDTLKG